MRQMSGLSGNPRLPGVPGSIHPGTVCSSFPEEEKNLLFLGDGG